MNPRKNRVSYTPRTVRVLAKRALVRFPELRKQAQQRVNKIYRDLYNLDNEVRVRSGTR